MIVILELGMFYPRRLSDCPDNFPVFGLKPGVGLDNSGDSGRERVIYLESPDNLCVFPGKRGVLSRTRAVLRAQGGLLSRHWVWHAKCQGRCGTRGARGKVFSNSFGSCAGYRTLKVPIVARGSNIMTIYQANKIIESGNPVTVHNSLYNETFTCTFVSRSRYNIMSSDGGVYDRGDLEIVRDLSVLQGFGG